MAPPDGILSVTAWKKKQKKHAETPLTEVWPEVKYSPKPYGASQQQLLVLHHN